MRISGNQGIRILGFLLCVLCVSAVNLYAGNWPNFSNDGGGNWQPGYYRPISVTNSTGAAQIDYQVAIILTTAALGNPYTHIKADGSDIRFSTNPPPYSGTELSYWIDSWNNTGNSTIWVKVPNLPAGDSNIYMYYGNISATASSNGTNTFVFFFDDFNRADSSTVGNGWSSSYNAGAGINNNMVKVTADRNGFKRTLANGNNIVVSGKGNWTGSNNHWVTVRESTAWPPAGLGISIMRIGNTFGIIDGGLNKQSAAFVTSDGVWYNWEFAIASDYAVDARIWATGSPRPAAPTVSQPAFSPGSSGTDFQVMMSYGVAGPDYWDDFYVRKYAAPEPAATAPGTEAQYSMTKWVQSANWTSIVKAANKVTMGDNIAVISFTAVAAGTITTAHWRRFRIDETGGQPIEKLSVSVYEESGNDGFFDAADKFIASGTFNSSRTCTLNMNRWPLGTTAKTYYIVEKVALDGSGGQTIRLNIVDGTYFDFEEGPCIGVPP